MMNRSLLAIFATITLDAAGIGLTLPIIPGLLRDVGLVMKDASICGLGQAAWNAVESAIDRLGVLEKSR